MFYRGVLHTYDPAKKTGLIRIEEQNIDIHFDLVDLTNAKICPKIGEKVKCIVVNKDGHQQAKFIVRLEDTNSNQHNSKTIDSVVSHSVHPQAINSNTHTQSNQARASIQNKTQSLQAKTSSTIIDKTMMGEVEVPLDFPVHNFNEEFGRSNLNASVKPIQEISALKNIIEKQQSETEQLLESQRQQRKFRNQTQAEHQSNSKAASATVKNQQGADVKTFYQQRFNNSKIQSPTRNENYAQTSNRSGATKKLRNMDTQVTPWIFSSITPILILMNFGIWGFQSYQKFQEEQETKVRLFAIEQLEIIKELKKEALH